MRLKADLTLFMIAIIWGSAFVAQRVAGQMGSVYLFNGARFLLGGLIVFPFAIQNKTIDKLSPDQWLWMLVAGIILFVAAALQQAGLLYTTAGNAGFITSLYVVLVPVVLFIFWKETPHWLAILAVVVAAFGAFLLSSNGISFKLQSGDGLELIGAGLWTCHVILLGKFASRFDALTFSVGQLIICGLLNLGLGAFVEHPVSIETAPLILAVIFTALFSIALGYTLQVWAQRHTPPADAALILSLESVFAALAGWLFLRETMTLIQVFGCTLIFAAVLFSQVKPRVSE